MEFTTEKIDYAFILSVTASAVLLSLLDGLVFQLPPASIEIAAPLSLIAATVFAFRTRRTWKEMISRYVEIISTGLFFMVFGWSMAVIWPILPPDNFLNFGEGFLLTFFRLLAAAGAITVGYGFYTMGKKGEAYSF